MRVGLKALLHMSLVLFGLCLPVHAGLAQTPAASEPAVSPKETLASLRQRLPASWQVALVDEPVSRGKMLVLEAGRQNTQTVVLVHGLGQKGWLDWEGLMPRLAQNYHVIALDLPGFGLSSSGSMQYSPANYARVLDAMLATRAQGPVVMIGHSMGGAVSLRYTANYPDKVKQLILIDMAGGLERAAFVKDAAKIPALYDKIPSFLRGFAASIKQVSDEWVERFMSLSSAEAVMGNIWVRGTMDSQTNVNAALALLEDDFSKAAYSVPQATTIIWGEKDSVAPLRTGHVLAATLPRASLHIIPGAGHTPMDTHLDALTALVVDALRTPPPAPQRQPDSVLPERRAGLADANCNNEDGLRFSGDYRNVIIDNCSNVQLIDVRAEQMLLNNAVVELRNVSVTSTGTPLIAVNSVVVGTNVRLSGDTAVQSDASRLDLAGAQFAGSKSAVEVKRPSRLIFSLGRSNSPLYQGYLHGVFNLAAQTWR